MRTTAPRLLIAASLAVVATRVSAQSPGRPVTIDFSYAGYRAGEPLATVPAVVTVRPTGLDDTALLQGAIDRIATLPIESNGFRGALILQPGRYHVSGQLLLRNNGIVLRGVDTQTTTIVAEGIDRRALIVIGAKSDPALAPSRQVQADARAGAMTLILETVDGLQVGDAVVIRRPSTTAWISAMGMSGLPGTFANQRLDWQPGSHDLVWDRSIIAIDADTKRVTLDAPITTALETIYGGGSVAKVIDNQPPTNFGVEDLTLESAFDPKLPKDEEHAWIAVQIDHAADVWVRLVTARHFVSSAVRVNWRGRRVTIADVHSEAPVAESGGYRRQSFLVDGQQVLVYKSTGEAGMNDFASGLLAGGPNVFLDDTAIHPLGASGAFEGWASGVLYENVNIPQQPLQLILDFSRAQGAGWTAANSLIWNSTAKTVDALGPPGQQNYVVNSPQALYGSQLFARTGKHLALDAIATSPPDLPEFRSSDVIEKPPPKPIFLPVGIVNGRFVVNDQILWGSSQGEAWWRGDTSPYTAQKSTGSSVTRFMPGVTAPGETEDLAEFAQRIKARHAIAIQVNPGLWYEHRRDAHTDERRDDGNVWAPFYEVPWARSGQGIAWDGLSKLDLTRYNPWYFDRQREFASQAAQDGFIVFYDLYNTHNVLEIGPHFIDYAWRPANNINQTGLPEPPPLKPHNRNDVANEFYSTANPSLRALHRTYMLHTFDVLGDQPNVIFGLAYQYAGPLEFEQFFQDVAREWENEHHRHLRIALTTSKQTTDAILADPVRAKQIAVVDMRYWEYRPDGTLFAPRAGENHAFRELISQAFPGYTDTPPSTTPEMVYRQTREYHDKFPNIAFMPMENGAGPIPILMGGGASQSGLVARPPAPKPTPEQQASAMYPQRAAQNPATESENPDRILDAFIERHLATSLMRMSPEDGWTKAPERTWTLAGSEADPVLIYSLTGPDITLARALPATQYNATWFDPHSGAETPGYAATGSSGHTFVKPNTSNWLLFLKPK